MKRIAGMLLGAALATVAAMPAAAEPEYDAGEQAMVMGLDLLVARPLGLVITALGTATFVASLPFSAAGGNVDEAAEVLVMGPVRTTFLRCLGCVTDTALEDRR